MAAAEGRSIAAVRAFLAAGADVNAKDKDDRTALARAARNRDATVVQELLAAGADANVRDKNGVTALKEATGINFAVIQALLDAGAKWR